MLRIALTSLALGLLSFTAPISPAAENSPEISTSLNKAANRNGSTLSFSEKVMAFDAHVQGVYQQAGLKEKGLSYEVFRNAYVGFQNFKNKKLASASNSILTVVDFTKPSSNKRMWIIDLKSKKVLFNTLVAHGRNTGNVTADKFSNQPNSYMSSVGFYLTDATYYGKHGLSLRLSGMDKEYNSNAMTRAIVVHGADYATEAFIKQNGRLGRSLGCPAVPREISKDVIETIKNKTVMYIHGNEKNYSSNYLDQEAAINAFAANDLDDLVTV
ncbi:murein L,D-transpeptidase catalytic domain family protein [Pontibacter cellulosilyticus]|uniref:Murein L,D-transpeptidase catalytic domain family protein n=1 Tax=Pontibacter cellulosilyticus TaxID=1720253 RepID=A0A923N2X6_9BACT|nr:murein L,D-transpeptidase catalytic domain family protein [Pontibacter cellulosilyticus]MBC5991453.1 murein L,D-transpeptidase catalytic domain family protein [Pontibacter cellulosilyticus]